MKLLLAVILCVCGARAFGRPPEGLPWSAAGTLFESAPTGGWATTQPAGCELTFRWLDAEGAYWAVGPSGTPYLLVAVEDTVPQQWVFRDGGTQEEGVEWAAGETPIGLPLSIPRYDGAFNLLGETRFVCSAVDFGEKWDYVLIVRQMGYGMAFWFCWEFGLCALGLGFQAITRNAESLFLR
jgi:hypothetical protein